MKPRERRLLMILTLLAALAGMAILTQRLLRRQHLVERREQSLALRQTEARAMLADAPLWQERLGWLHNAQPVMSSANQASEELLETLVRSATRHTLSVQKKQLHEGVTKSFYSEVGVTLTVKGDLPSVFRWLHTLLAPDAFRVVSQLRITPDEADKSAVVATARYSQLYAPATAGKEPGS